MIVYQVIDYAMDSWGFSYAGQIVGTYKTEERAIEVRNARYIKYLTGELNWARQSIDLKELIKVKSLEIED